MITIRVHISQIEPVDLQAFARRLLYRHARDVPLDDLLAACPRGCDLPDDHIHLGISLTWTERLLVAEAARCEGLPVETWLRRAVGLEES